jgi:hypothetical protein
MVDITLVELHVEDGSLSTNLPFSGISSEDEDDRNEDVAGAEGKDEDEGSSRGLALLGVLVLLIVGTAAVKYLSGEDDESDVAVETDEESTPIAAE